MDINNIQNTEAPQFLGTNLSPQHQQKFSKMLLGLIGLVIVVGLVIFGIKYAKNSQISYAEKVYSNDKFGFEVKIPSDWTVEESNSSNELFFYSAASRKENEARALRCKDSSVRENDPMECSNRNVDMYFTNASYATGSNNKTEVINGITWTVLEGENSGLQYETRRGKVPFHFKLSLLPENKAKMVEFLSTFKFTPTVYDWKTYNNTQDGYYIQYPSDWNWQGNDIYSYSPEGWERGNPSGVKIQIQKRESSESSFEKEIAKLNLSNNGQNSEGATETKIESKIIGNFTHYNKVLSGPGGAFEIYYAPGKKTKTYFAVLVWGAENQLSVVSKILSSFKTTGSDSSSEKTFFNTPFGLEFTLPIGYVARSNHFGIQDPTKAEAFDFIKEKDDFNRAPVLDVSTLVEPSAGQSFTQFIQYVYSLNKNKNQVTTDLKQTSYGGIAAYEFGLQVAFTQPVGGQLLGSSGAKVMFLQHGGKTFKFLLTGEDSGLASILKSLKFINKNSGSSDWQTYTNTDYSFQLTLPNTWRGYRVTKTQRINNSGSDYVFEVPTSSGYYKAFTIIAMDKATDLPWSQNEPHPAFLESSQTMNFYVSFPQDIPEELVGKINANEVVKTFSVK